MNGRLSASASSGGGCAQASSWATSAARVCRIFGQRRLRQRLVDRSAGDFSWRMRVSMQSWPCGEQLGDQQLHDPLDGGRRRASGGGNALVSGRGQNGTRPAASRSPLSDGGEASCLTHCCGGKRSSASGRRGASDRNYRAAMAAPPPLTAVANQGLADPAADVRVVVVQALDERGRRLARYFASSCGESPHQRAFVAGRRRRGRLRDAARWVINSNARCRRSDVAPCGRR